MPTRRVALALLVAYLALVGFVVFSPSPEVASSSVESIHTVLQRLGAPGWVSLFAVEFATNVALFVPLGLLGSVVIPRWPVKAWLLAGGAASTAIELAQLVLLPDRSAAWYDVLANTLGAVLGALLASAMRERTQ